MSTQIIKYAEENEGLNTAALFNADRKTLSVAKKTAGGPLGDLCSCSESSRAGWASGGRRSNH